MIVVKNRWFPFSNFLAQTWLCFLFVRACNAWRLNGRTKRHERIHMVQQIELSVLAAVVMVPVGVCCKFAWWGWVLTVIGILFAGYIAYGVSNLVELFCKPRWRWYYYSCFETEAYNHQDEVGYLRRRIPYWGFLKHIPNRKVRYKGGK